MQDGIIDLHSHSSDIDDLSDADGDYTDPNGPMGKGWSDDSSETTSRTRCRVSIKSTKKNRHAIRKKDWNKQSKNNLQVDNENRNTFSIWNKTVINFSMFHPACATLQGDDVFDSAHDDWNSMSYLTKHFSEDVFVKIAFYTNLSVLQESGGV